MENVDRVVMFSGGVGSWAAAKRVATRYGTERLTLLFTDTLVEDYDLYRFLVEAAGNIFGSPPPRLDAAVYRALDGLDHTERADALAPIRGALCGSLPQVAWLQEGRSIWEVFEDERYLGNTRADPCSKILKRQMADRWLSSHLRPESTVVYVGIDWTEVNRFDRLRERRCPWVYEAPLCGPPYTSKAAMLDSLAKEGLAAPRLYGLGFSHNNCGGGCVKAGIGHFSHLYRVLPQVFAQWEGHEERLRRKLGDVSILRNRQGGVTKPLTLSVLRDRLDAGGQVDQLEIGGCGCFIDGE